MRNRNLNYGNLYYLIADHSEELQISGSAIPDVKLFKYLGSTAEVNGCPDLEIKKN
jgi:hypothetical protein